MSAPESDGMDYLTRNKLATLVDDMLIDVLVAEPEDPMLFMARWMHARRRQALMEAGKLEFDAPANDIPMRKGRKVDHDASSTFPFPGGIAAALQEQQESGTSHSNNTPALTKENAPAAPAATTTPSSTFDAEAFLKRLDEVRASHPGNRCAKYLTREVFNSYPEAEREMLYRCAKTGAENPDSGIGCYILTPDHLRHYRKFFDPLIRDYHKAGPTDKHITDWDISAVGDKGVLD
eukprot:PhM_4_TR476/c0_g2_i4/m.27531